MLHQDYIISQCISIDDALKGHSFLHQEFAEVLAGGFYYWLFFLLAWEGQESLFGPCEAWSSMLESVCLKAIHGLKATTTNSNPL